MGQRWSAPAAAASSAGLSCRRRPCSTRGDSLEADTTVLQTSRFQAQRCETRCQHLPEPNDGGIDDHGGAAAATGSRAAGVCSH